MHPVVKDSLTSSSRLTRINTRSWPKSPQPKELALLFWFPSKGVCILRSRIEAGTLRKCGFTPCSLNPGRQHRRRYYNGDATFCRGVLTSHPVTSRTRVGGGHLDIKRSLFFPLKVPKRIPEDSMLIFYSLIPRYLP